MPTYEYIARDERGQIRRGTLTAVDPWQAIQRLREDGLYVIRIHEQAPPTLMTAFRAPAKPMAAFFRHLYNTYRAGVSLSESLSLFASTDRSPLKTVAAYAAKRVSQGTPLSQALRETGYPFPVFVLPMIETGERGGQLERIFSHLTAHFEREAEMEQEYKRHTIFAKAYAGCAVGAMLFILGIASSLGAHHPLVGSIKGVLKWGALFLGLWALWRFLSINRWTAPYVETLWLHLPFISVPWQKLMAARFARTLALLYASGIEPGQSLLLAAQATGSPLLIGAAEKLAPRLQQGESFLTAVRKMPLLPPIVQQMLATGEISGDIDESLEKAAEFLESEAQTGLKVYPIVAGFVLYGLVLLVLVYLIFQGLGGIISFYRSIP